MTGRNESLKKERERDVFWLDFKEVVSRGPSTEVSKNELAK